MVSFGFVWFGLVLGCYTHITTTRGIVGGALSSTGSVIGGAGGMERERDGTVVVASSIGYGGGPGTGRAQAPPPPSLSKDSTDVVSSTSITGIALAGKDWTPHLSDNSLALRWNKVQRKNVRTVLNDGCVLVPPVLLPRNGVLGSIEGDVEIPFSEQGTDRAVSLGPDRAVFAAGGDNISHEAFPQTKLLSDGGVAASGATTNTPAGELTSGTGSGGDTVEPPPLELLSPDNLSRLPLEDKMVSTARVLSKVETPGTRLSSETGGSGEMGAVVLDDISLDFERRKHELPKRIPIENMTTLEEWYVHASSNPLGFSCHILNAALTLAGSPAPGGVQQEEGAAAKHRKMRPITRLEELHLLSPV